MLALLIIAAQVAQGWVVANKVQVAVQDTCDTRTFEKGRDYRVVSRESGSERNDLPIFTNTPGTVKLSATEKPPVSRLDYPNIPGAFLLHNVLTPQECDELLRFSEAMGYTEDAPVSLGRHIRQNENCVWIADSAMNDGIFGRIRAYLPPEVQGGAAVGLNRRWRLYKYGPDDIFRMHTDGSWPGSGLDSNGRLVRDIFGDRMSQLTVLLYLNDDFTGGPTRFFLPTRDGEDQRNGSFVNLNGILHRIKEAKPEKGAVLCFFHGDHPLSPLHEGGLVHTGTKYLVRTDALYQLPG